MEDAPPPADTRMKWLEDRICGLLRAKPELFQKIVQSEDDGDKLKQFCNEETPTQLFFAGGAKEITMTETFPANHRKKIVYLQKVAETKLTEANIFDEVVVGDLNAPLLESLHGMLRNVYLPIISNPDNTRGWPEVAMKAFNDRFNHTLNGVIVAIGQTKGKTLLALPPSESLSGSGAGSRSQAGDRQDKDRVHVLESAVVMWTERINMALSRSPESAFNNGEHPGCVAAPLRTAAAHAHFRFVKLTRASAPRPFICRPLVGLDFWVTKMTDLGEVIDQLHGPQIAKVSRHRSPPPPPPDHPPRRSFALSPAPTLASACDRS